MILPSAWLLRGRAPLPVRPTEPWTGGQPQSREPLYPARGLARALRQVFEPVLGTPREPSPQDPVHPALTSRFAPGALEWLTTRTRALQDHRLEHSLAALLLTLAVLLLWAR